MVNVFVDSKIRHDKVTLFVKGTCPYCRNAVALLQKFNFLPGHLEVVDITGMEDVQDYFQRTTGQRTVSAGAPVPEFCLLCQLAAGTTAAEGEARSPHQVLSAAWGCQTPRNTSCLLQIAAQENPVLALAAEGLVQGAPSRFGDCDPNSPSDRALKLPESAQSTCRGGRATSLSEFGLLFSPLMSSRKKHFKLTHFSRQQSRHCACKM